jgi:hypothetical protein
MIENGKIRRIEEYMDGAEALQAVGLPEQAMSHESLEL